MNLSLHVQIRDAAALPDPSTDGIDLAWPQEEVEDVLGVD